MGKETDQIYYDFTNDYKKLPMKNRIGLIKTARNLLRQQKADSVLLADLTAFSPICEGKKNQDNVGDTKKV